MTRSDTLDDSYDDHIIKIGSSCEYFYWERGRQKAIGIHQPVSACRLLEIFFPIFYRLGIAQNPWVMRDGLIYYLEHVRNIKDSDQYLRSGVNIESLHSEIALQLAEFEKDDGVIERVVLSKPYIQLIFLFAATLNEIANGPVSRPHLELASVFSSQDTVITFNWDTLIERALMTHGSWRVDDGYAMKPRKVFRDTWKNPKVDGNDSRVMILKLHGSTNWLTSYPFYEGEELVLTHGLPPESLFVFESASRPYATYAGRYMDGYEPFTYGYYPPNLLDVPGRPAMDGYTFVQMRPRFPWIPEGAGDDRGVVSMPLIIPPVRHKSYGFFGNLFDDLWQKAQTALANCDEIVIIGYSFPETDTRSNDLFIRAFSGRSTIPLVKVIDPNPRRVLDKLRLEYGIPETSIQVVDETFEGTTTLKKLSGFR